MCNHVSYRLRQLSIDFFIKNSNRVQYLLFNTILQFIKYNVFTY
jgi:hypothetical protein